MAKFLAEYEIVAKNNPKNVLVSGGRIKADSQAELQQEMVWMEELVARQHEGKSLVKWLQFYKGITNPKEG